MRNLIRAAGRLSSAALLAIALAVPSAVFAAVDTASPFWARGETTTPRYFEVNDIESEYLEPQCRLAAAQYTNFVFDYVNIRGNEPRRIADCYGHSFNPSNGYVGQPGYYYVYFREHCPQGFGTGWEPVPDQCARVVRECPYPKVENPQTHVCEAPPCPPGSVPNGLGTSCVPLANPAPRNPPPPSCTKDLAAGNPIFPLRGVKREEVDFGLRVGLLPLKFTYDTTLRLQVDNTSPGSLEPGVLGTSGWYSNFHRRIIVEGRGEVVQIDRGDGYRVAFRANGTGYAPSNGHLDRLESAAGGYRYFDTAAQTEEFYDAEGKVLSIAWSGGRAIAFTYSDASTSATDAPAPGFLLEAGDDHGRSLRFRYNAGGRLIEVLDVSGQPYPIAYTSEGMLGSITLPDARKRGFQYTDSRHFWALTSVQHEYNNPKARFSYDDAGRAISTESAGGINRYSVTYASPPGIRRTDTYDEARDIMVRTHEWLTPAGTTLTDPLGGRREVGTAAVQGKTYLSSQSQPAGAGCAASTSSQGFDANGNLSQRDDFNGTRTCYANDLSRNLETTRVEGLSQSATCSSLTPANAALPVGGRKISTQWHPDWRIETKRAEPGRITTSVYNGQPDPFNGNTIASCAPASALLPDGKPIAVLCKQVEQATTDANGAAAFSAELQAGVTDRVNAWTYNERGQVLTENGPRTDVDDTTTYVYYADTTADHTMGDLQTVTNAAGGVTQYTKFNRHGQLLETTDANGVMTLNTYDNRQRLLSTSVGGEVTSYQYDARSRLTRVTLPDNTWIGYQYDEASRQTAVFDHKGNRINYVLDKLGNRTSEVTRNAAGVRRQLTRSIDALGRVQQTRGRE